MLSQVRANLFVGQAILFTKTTLYKELPHIMNRSALVCIYAKWVKMLWFEFVQNCFCLGVDFLYEKRILFIKQHFALYSTITSSRGPFPRRSET